MTPQRRRPLMQAWERYCSQPETAKVLKLRRQCPNQLDRRALQKRTGGSSNSWSLIRGRILERVGKPKPSDLHAWRKAALALLTEFVRSTITVSWQELCDREHYIRDWLLRGPRDDEVPDSEMLRAWWAAVQRFFQLLSRKLPSQACPKGTPKFQSAVFPPELRATMAGLAGYLAATIPLPISEVGKVGRPAMPPSELRDLDSGPIAYRDACRRKGSSMKVWQYASQIGLQSALLCCGISKKANHAKLAKRHPRALPRSK